MSWLFIIIISYLFFALFSFFDKLILSGPTSPKAYTFYIGTLNILALALVPFGGLGIPPLSALPWIIAESIFFLLGLYFMFLALEKFEVSRVMPIIWGIQPFLVLLFGWILFKTSPLKTTEFIAFFMFIAASFLISAEKKISFNKNLLKLAIIADVMFALDYVFLKSVFLQMPFLPGLIWTRIFIFFFAALLLFDKKLREDVFKKKQFFHNRETLLIFASGQISGAIANFLQSIAIALAPVSRLAFMNSLRAIQYIFLFLLTLISSSLFPKLLREKISRKIIIQKLASLLLIFAGLAVLYL